LRHVGGGGSRPTTRRAECGIGCYKELKELYVNEYEERGYPLRGVGVNPVKIREAAESWRLAGRAVLWQ